MLLLVSPGYRLRFSATQYEFDVNVYSPVGTVVFEAFIFAEDAINLVIMGAAFSGSEANYGRFSINGMDLATEIIPVRSSNLLTIRIAESLDPEDNEAIYEFNIVSFAVSLVADRSESQAGVILHEISKLLASWLVTSAAVYSKKFYVTIHSYVYYVIMKSVKLNLMTTVNVELLANLLGV